jgi:hypothetical protein
MENYNPYPQPTDENISEAWSYYELSTFRVFVTNSPKGLSMAEVVRNFYKEYPEFKTPVIKAQLLTAAFDFEMPDNSIYSARWFPHSSAEQKGTFEVAIYKDSGYRVSFYTDHRICEKNSMEFLQKYLTLCESKKEVKQP